MKTKIVKMMMPIGVIALAITGAMATSPMMANDSNTTKMGYIDSPNPCQISVQCSTVGNQLCKNSNNQQAFGKETPKSTSCEEVLYRLQ